MKRRTIQHHMDALIALLLFGIFAACVLTVLMTGAGAYRRLTQRDQSSYEYRTRTQYIATRIRQADRLDSISVEAFDDTDALILTDEDGYITRIYCYEGYLMELYTSADASLSPGDGEKLMEVSSLKLSLENNLLSIIITGPEGDSDTLCLSLRSGKGEAA